MAAPRSVSLPCTHKQAHAGIAATGGRMKMKEREERRGGEEKSPCGRGRFSSSLNQLMPPPHLHCSLHRSLPVTHHTNLSSASFLLLPPLSLFQQPLFCFSHHLPILSILPSYSLLFRPPSLGFHCFVLSLFLYSTSLILSHSGRAAGRQKQHTLMLLYLTRHTHSCAPCTTAQT